MAKSNSKKSVSFIDRIKALYQYCIEGVWQDPRDNMRVRLVKTLNLTLNSFFNSSLQNKSMSLTYTTILSIVPALALIVAIGRGFGLQQDIIRQLFVLFPAQSEAISTVNRFVDSYLKNASQGIFVGIGIVVLLWTIISLLSQIEETFNAIWNIKQSRAFYQKITDYIAICVMIPVLMICQSGVSFFMSDVIQANLNLPYLTPLLNILLALAPLFLCWIAFTLCYYLIPNTKVQFKYAAISGALGAFAFQVLEYLFLNGQLYVSKYNAIYGSFAFLPLLLVWLQLSWLVLLTGCMLAYSMQNVFTFNLMGDEEAISDRGWHLVGLIVMAVIAQRFAERKKPHNEQEIAVEYGLPIRIVDRVVTKLKKAELIYDVSLPDDEHAIAPAVEVETLSVGDFLRAFDYTGVTDFLPNFRKVYAGLLDTLSPLLEDSYEMFDKVLIKNLTIPSPQTIREAYVNTIPSHRLPVRSE